MSTGIRDELLVLKGKLELLEKELTDQMMELELKAEKWAKIDENAELLIKTNSILCINTCSCKIISCSNWRKTQCYQ